MFRFSSKQAHGRLVYCKLGGRSCEQVKQALNIRFYARTISLTSCCVSTSMSIGYCTCHIDLYKIEIS